MQTIKTGVVVALLLAVCYGAFVALNAPEPALPDELLSEFDWSPEEAGLENLTSVEMPSAESLALQAPASNDLNASGGLGTFDASNMSLPTLPTSNIAPLNNSATAAGAPPSAGTLPNAADLALPSVSLPGFPSGSAGLSSSLSLPTLPADPTVTQSNFNPQATIDGPSVSLGLGTTAQSPSGGASTQGQLIGLKRSATDEVDSDSSTGSPNQAPPTLPFPDAREQALELAASGKLREALQILTHYYDSPELTSRQHADLVDLLDALSREVIYSPRHLAESPYTVTASDTVETLAQKYQITPELLTAINGLGNSKALINGSQIKVLPGPFRAVVSLSRHELTVFMGDLYAGRFPVSFGIDPSPVEGAYEIIDRRRDRTYYGTGAKVIAANDNRNPYGGYWLNLGQDLCIHGTPEMASDDLQGAGCISLAPLDAADVYNILVQTSQVSIVH